MSEPPFGTRLGYAMWLYHLTTGRAPAFAKIGEAVGRTGQAVSAWLERPSAPDYALHKPLARFLEVSLTWLVDGEEDPPHPDLWPVWLQERRDRHRERSTLDPTPSRVFTNRAAPKKKAVKNDGAKSA